MSRRKDRERAKAGLIFRDGKLVKVENHPARTSESLMAEQVGG